jgi:hypothetical protein
MLEAFSDQIVSGPTLKLPVTVHLPHMAWNFMMYFGVHGSRDIEFEIGVTNESSPAFAH